MYAKFPPSDVTVKGTVFERNCKHAKNEKKAGVKTTHVTVNRRSNELRGKISYAQNKHAKSYRSYANRNVGGRGGARCSGRRPDARLTWKHRKMDSLPRGFG